VYFSSNQCVQVLPSAEISPSKVPLAKSTASTLELLLVKGDVVIRAHRRAGHGLDTHGRAGCSRLYVTSPASPLHFDALLDSATMR